MSRTSTPEIDDLDLSNCGHYSSCSDLELDLGVSSYATAARKKWKEKEEKISKNCNSLLDISAKFIGKNIPFEMVEKSSLLVPEELQELIAFYSFPTDEQCIWLYSVLSCGGAHEFIRGEELWAGSSVFDCIQIGFNLSATVVSKRESVKRFANNCDYVVHQVSLFYDRGIITKCYCTCTTDLEEDDPGGPMKNSEVDKKPTSSTVFLDNNMFNCSQRTTSSLLYHMRNNQILKNEQGIIQRCFSNHKKNRLPKRNIWTVKALNNSSNFGAPLMEPFVDPMMCNGIWCSHIVAVCLKRIREPETIARRPPISESLGKMSREQLQKLVQNLITELAPKRILPKAQRIIDQLLDKNDNSLKNCPGAPDPSSGGGIDQPATWSLDTLILKDKILLTLQRFSTVKSKVLTDVDALTDYMHPEAEELKSILESFCNRSNKGIWDLLIIIEKMLKKGDCNAIPLLEILTRRILSVQEIMKGWYMVEVYAENVIRLSNRSKQSMLYSSAWLCEAVVELWKMVLYHVKHHDLYGDGELSMNEEKKTLVNFQINWSLIKEDSPLFILNKNDDADNQKEEICKSITCQIVNRLRLFHSACLEQVNVSLTKMVSSNGIRNDDPSSGNFSRSTLGRSSHHSRNSTSRQNRNQSNMTSNSKLVNQNKRASPSSYNDLLSENVFSRFEGFKNPFEIISLMKIVENKQIPQIFSTKSQWKKYLPSFDGSRVKELSENFLELEKILDNLLKDSLEENNLNKSSFPCSICTNYLDNNADKSNTFDKKESEIAQYIQSISTFFNAIDHIYTKYESFLALDKEEHAIEWARLLALFMLNKSKELFELVRQVGAYSLYLLGTITDLRRHNNNAENSLNNSENKPTSSIPAFTSKNSDYKRSKSNNVNVSNSNSNNSYPNNLNYSGTLGPSTRKSTNNQNNPETASLQMKRENTSTINHKIDLLDRLCTSISDLISMNNTRILNLCNTLAYHRNFNEKYSKISTQEWLGANIDLYQYTYDLNENLDDIELATRLLLASLAQPRLPCYQISLDARILNLEIEIFNFISKLSFTCSLYKRNHIYYTRVYEICKSECKVWESAFSEEKRLVDSVYYTLQVPYLLMAFIFCFVNSNPDSPDSEYSYPKINSNLLYNYSSPIVFNKIKINDEETPLISRIKSEERVGALKACLNSLKVKCILASSFCSEQLFPLSNEINRIRHRILLVHLISTLKTNGDILSGILDAILDPTTNPHFQCPSLDEIFKAENPEQIIRLMNTKEHLDNSSMEKTENEIENLRLESENPNQPFPVTRRNEPRKITSASSDEAVDKLGEVREINMSNVKFSIDINDRHMRHGRFIDSSAPETTSSGEVSPNIHRKFLDKIPKGQPLKITESKKFSLNIDCEDDDSSILSNPEEVQNYDQVISSKKDENDFLQTLASCVINNGDKKNLNQVLCQSLGQTSEAGSFFYFHLAKSISHISGNHENEIFSIGTFEDENLIEVKSRIASFMVLLYGLGVSNRWSQYNWLYRTHNTIAKTILSEVSRIGWRAGYILLCTWQNHLTPAELSEISHVCIVSSLPFMREIGIELSISCLKGCIYMIPSEVLKILENCSKDASILNRALIEATNAYRKSSCLGILPELMFHIAKYWHKLYLIEVKKDAPSANSHLKKCFRVGMEGLGKVFKNDKPSFNDGSSHQTANSSKTNRNLTNNSNSRLRSQNPSSQFHSKTLPGDNSKISSFDLISQNKNIKFYLEQILWMTNISITLGLDEVKEMTDFFISLLKCPMIMELIVCELEKNIEKFSPYPITNGPYYKYPNQMSFNQLPEVNTSLPPPPLFHTSNSQPILYPHNNHYMNHSPISLSGQPSSCSQSQNSIHLEYLDILQNMINRIHTLYQINIDHQIHYLGQNEAELDQLIDLLLKAYYSQMKRPPTNNNLMWSDLIMRIYKNPKCSSVLWNRISSALQLSDFNDYIQLRTN